MAYVIVSLLATICMVGATYGTECSLGPGYRFPITCPGMLNSTKSYCCEIDGSFRCCDAEEFASLGRPDNDTELLVPRHKRDYPFVYEGAAVGLGGAAIAGIILAAISPLLLICCCCFCACCPCYYCCRSPNSTNVTVVQPAGGGGTIVQNNMCVTAPTQPAMQQPCAMMPLQQAPPAYDPRYEQKSGVPNQI